MRDYVEETWGWDEDWQRQHFAATYAPAQHAVIVRLDPAPRDVGRISLTRHWRKIFLRDIELVAAERNRGVGTALIRALLMLAKLGYRADVAADGTEDFADSLIAAARLTRRVRQRRCDPMRARPCPTTASG